MESTVIVPLGIKLSHWHYNLNYLERSKTSFKAKKSYFISLQIYGTFLSELKLIKVLRLSENLTTHVNNLIQIFQPVRLWYAK